MDHHHDGIRPGTFRHARVKLETFVVDFRVFDVRLKLSRDGRRVFLFPEQPKIEPGQQSLPRQPDAPDARLAWCLGPANWMAGSGEHAWLEGHTASRRCYRPEEVSVATVDSSPLVVQTANFSGSVGELEVLDREVAPLTGA